MLIWDLILLHQKLVTIKISTILLCEAAFLSGNEAAPSENENVKSAGMFDLNLNFPNSSTMSH